MFMYFQEIEEIMESRKKFGIKPGLERMNHLLHLLHHPEKRFKSVHVAGTNGKGSTIQFMKKALMANGQRVGVFTSPSLSGLTGHIWCNEQEISRQEWLTLMNDIYPIIKQLDRKGIHLTSFEIITAVAFVYFSKNVHIALVETGMGGRLDTTNCVHPIVTIITNVSMDHTAFLGKRLEDIAYHKAGIIKLNTPVILGSINKDIVSVFQHEAKDKNAPTYQLFHDFTYTHVQIEAYNQHFNWQYREQERDVRIVMQGAHQVENAANALMGVTLLKEQGIDIDWQLTLKGIYETTLPGRFEIVQYNPMIIVDGAHNPAGIETFIKTVQANYPSEEKHVLFAAYKDKDAQTMLDSLSTYFQSMTLTSFADERAASAAYLYNLTTHNNKQKVPEWKDAVNQLAPRQERVRSIYFITGSLAFITQVRFFILNRVWINQ